MLYAARAGRVTYAGMTIRGLRMGSAHCSAYAAWGFTEHLAG